MSCNEGHKNYKIVCTACGYENITCHCEILYQCPQCGSEEDIQVEKIKGF